ncbi:hypothetical protein [Bradyrhizobium phage BDU-MI-1]|nr:hypothetical protein [Bradyrhizobium phage BDU-MI-1]
MDLHLIKIDRLRKSFEKKYIPEPNSGCWLWLGSIDKNSGYGKMSSTLYTAAGHPLPIGAHRASVILDRGYQCLEGKVDVCHRCDNPSCVNPEHLFVGTHAENMADAKAKGRMRHGEDHEQAVLTNEQAIAIANATGPDWYVAEKFGVSSVTVASVRSGRSWARVTGLTEINRKIKLSDEQVAAIQNEPQSFGVGRRLANKYGVSESMISLIRNGLRRLDVAA